LDADGFTIRNLYRRHFHRWADVVGFSVDHAGKLRQPFGGLLQLGRQVTGGLGDRRDRDGRVDIRSVVYQT
jgi:hypothetical protein